MKSLYDILLENRSEMQEDELEIMSKILKGYFKSGETSVPSYLYAEVSSDVVKKPTSIDTYNKHLALTGIKIDRIVACEDNDCNWCFEVYPVLIK